MAIENVLFLLLTTSDIIVVSLELGTQCYKIFLVTLGNVPDIWVTSSSSYLVDFAS